VIQERGSAGLLYPADLHSARGRIGFCPVMLRGPGTASSSLQPAAAKSTCRGPSFQMPHKCLICSARLTAEVPATGRLLSQSF